MSVPTKPLWKLEAVSLSPRRLCDVTLEIGFGVTAVLGLSGAGKTSLLNLLVGFEKPSSGKIYGTTNCAWAPPSGGLWSHCTVREHLVHVGASEPDLLLEKFDLVTLAQNRPQQLSQGESSRLAAARALATKADVLVMDEPLSHVDHARTGKYWAAIRETVEEGTSLVFSSHTPEHVLALAQHAVCLQDGEVVFQGPVDALYHRPPTHEAMLFMGEGNWFAAAECKTWLGSENTEALCLRPETLTLEIDAAGAYRIVSSRFLGSHAETELRAIDGTTRLFYHRPSAPLSAGANARIADISRK